MEDRKWWLHWDRRTEIEEGKDKQISAEVTKKEESKGQGGGSRSTLRQEPCWRGGFLLLDEFVELASPQVTQIIFSIMLLS